MDDRPSADSLLEIIQGLAEALVNDAELDRHERANAANQIVLCASVLRNRVHDAESQLTEPPPTPVD